MVAIPVLVIGAGPFGLAMAGTLRSLGIPHVIVGRAMGFWRQHMPRGMLLRSGCDWHYDTANVDTIEAYLATLGKSPADAEPLSLETYLGYPQWFAERKGLQIRDSVIARLDRADGGFIATTMAGETIVARNVVLALGFAHFPRVPRALTDRLPVGRYRHTCDAVDLERYRGRRVLIIGGRQSAFEWAALLREEGARAVHLAYRHDTPQFTTSDWSWFNGKVDEMADDSEWFRRLPQEEKDAVNRRFWEEGRLKLEPWLAPRIAHDEVHLWPRTEVTASGERGSELSVLLSNGERIDVDDVILATGYEVDMDRIPLLAAGNVIAQLRTSDGFPCLDRDMQTNIPGLYITSMPAVRDFGLFFAFTISVRTSAKLIGAALARNLPGAVATNPPLSMEQ